MAVDRLQWSHSLSAMETGRLALLFRLFVLASMEPQPFGHGNSVTSRQELCEVAASMEPQPFGHGNGRNPHVIGTPVGASMEPQPFGHGNVHSRTGAVALFVELQWSHSLSAMETRSPSARGLRFRSLQWSHSLSAMETGQCQGAAAARGDASMEPQPFGHGNFAGANPPHLTVVASMEPQPFGHGNSGSTAGEGKTPCWLQWSHSLSAMET